ncbi:MAG: hypothetical protein HQL15_08065 [Candidatus Omnitrophica bacterium]|nr:hypothetical protein [Candidatus Omnitrophota bacterium]
MADKNMDPQVMMTTMMRVIESTFSKMSGVLPSSPSEAKEKDVVEYDGRLRVDGIEKFESPAYISVVNYYLTKEDMERHGRVKGAMILYVDVESSGKLFKALGFPFPDDEDDSSMMDCNGEFCNLLGGALKNELVNIGFSNLVMSAPYNYRSSIINGVEFSPDQKKMYEFNLFYFKRKSIVIELTMASIPLKK